MGGMLRDALGEATGGSRQDADGAGMDAACSGTAAACPGTAAACSGMAAACSGTVAPGGGSAGKLRQAGVHVPPSSVQAPWAVEAATPPVL